MKALARYQLILLGKQRHIGVPLGMTLAQTNCTIDLYCCMWQKSGGLIGGLCLKVSDIQEIAPNRAAFYSVKVSGTSFPSFPQTFLCKFLSQTQNRTAQFGTKNLVQDASMWPKLWDWFDWSAAFIAGIDCHIYCPAFLLCKSCINLHHVCDTIN